MIVGRLDVGPGGRKGRLRWASPDLSTPAPVKERVERDAASGTCPADPPDESPPAGADASHDALELARATLSDADAALEATHALSPGASDEDSDSDASEPATDGPDDEATDSGSVSLGVDEDGVWVGVLAGDGDFDDASDYDASPTPTIPTTISTTSTTTPCTDRGEIPRRRRRRSKRRTPSMTKSAACTCSPTANPSRASRA